MLEKIRTFPGDVGFYFENLATGATASFQPDRTLLAASVIKLPMMVEAFRQFESGMLNPAEPVVVRDADRVPSCGVLTYLHDGLTVTVRDLVTLSIIVSDNTATNLLMDILTIDRVNALLDGLDMPNTRLRRRMFDRQAAARGLQNTICAGEIGALLARLYRGDIVSPDACAQMLQILKDQQLNSKMPFLFAETIDIAHKTGEDSGISHDVGIVYADEPFVLCFCGNNIDAPQFERLMQDMTWEIVHNE